MEPTGAVDESPDRAVQEALAGRLPVLAHERIYGTYGSLLWTTAVLSTAGWAYLIGSALPAFGDARRTIAGYVVGLILGEIAVIFAVGIPCYRYGVDASDLAKSSFGTRGSVVLLIMVLGSTMGWAYVLIAMTARGVAQIAANATHQPAPPSESLAVAVALALLVLTWWLVRRGPGAMERLSRIFAPALIALALLILGLLLASGGISSLGHHGLAANRVATTDALTQIAYGVEFGFDNALSLLPFLGSLTRLVRHKRHLVGPTLFGSALISGALLAGVAALAADAYAVTDPMTWLIKLAGRGYGSTIMGVILIGNVATLVVLIYIAGVALQQIRVIATLRWEWIVALSLLPGAAFAWHTQWLLTQVMALLAYNGVIFVGLGAVMLTDFHFVRRERLRISHLFANCPKSAYWFRGGVNWLAIAVVAEAAGVYLWQFDPASLRVGAWFRYFGAGIPAFLVATITYAVLMRRMKRNGPEDTGSTDGSGTNHRLSVGL